MNLLTFLRKTDILYFMYYKKISIRRIFLFGFLFITIGSWAQETSPMYDTGWAKDESYNDHNGLSPREWVCETSGYALVEGEQTLFYLYNTYRYNEGSYKMIKVALFKWVKKMGYAIDFKNYVEYNPDGNIAPSIRSMMTERNYDVSVTLRKTGVNTAKLFLHNWDQKQDFWWTEIYPLSQ